MTAAQRISRLWTVRNVAALWAVLFVVAFGAAAKASDDGAQNVISLGDSITEIVFELGEEHRLVGRDQTSSFPEAALDIPDVGYVRRLSPEGVLSLAPDLIIAEEGAGPVETLDIIKASSVEYLEIADDYSFDGVVGKILKVAQALDVPVKGEALAAKIRAELDAAGDLVDAYEGEPRRVLFVLSLRGGRIIAGGAGTSADGIIRLAGGTNVLTDVDGWKQLSDEAVSALAPDAILMMDGGGSHSASNEELFAMPALATTPAAETQTVVRMSGQLMLGFGPRTAKAVTHINQALYAE